MPAFILAVLLALPGYAQEDGSLFTLRNRIEFNFGIDVNRMLYGGVLGYRIPLASRLALVPEASAATVNALLAGIRWDFLSVSRWDFFVQPSAGYSFSAGSAAVAALGAEYNATRVNSYVFAIRAIIAGHREAIVTGKNVRTFPPVIITAGFSF